MKDWIIIGKDRKIMSLLDDKIVLVAPTDTSNVVPLFCPCCDFPMKTSDDGVAYRKQKICSHCDDRWTGKPKVTWPEGPDKTTKDWDEYIKRRTLLSRPTISFK